MEKDPEKRNLLTAAAVILLVVIAGVFIWRLTSGPSAAQISRQRVFICAETGKPFDVVLSEGGTTPRLSPHSGKNTGYPAELCFWTKEGTAKEEPTAVLMNHWVNKEGPTYCPDCQRLVVPHNPRPVAGRKPPPLRGEAVPEAPERF